MPTPTYTPLANLTLSSSAASVTFSSISQAYRDLVLVVEGSSASGAANNRIRFNGDSGATYSLARMNGNGSTTFSDSYTSVNFPTLSTMNFTTTGRVIITASIMDYSATDKHKAVLARSGSDEAVGAVALRWENTSAINSLMFYSANSTFAAGSTFSLYGISA